MSAIESAWQPLFFFLLSRFRREGLTTDDAKSKAGQYNFWGSLGFNYSDFKFDVEEKVLPAKKRRWRVIENCQYLQDLWRFLNTKRDLLAPNVSISTGINLGWLQYNKCKACGSGGHFRDIQQAEILFALIFWHRRNIIKNK